MKEDVMKIKFDIKELVKGQKKSQERCLELIGKGTFSIADLEKTIEEIKNVNETLLANCNTTATIDTKTAGGQVNYMMTRLYQCYHLAELVLW